MAAKANIVIDQGNDFATTLTIRDSSGSVLDLTGYTAAAQIRKHYTSTTATNFTMQFESPRTDGKLTLKLDRLLTANLESGRYVYDLEILDTSANTKSRLIEGIATVTPQVTFTEGS